MEEAIAELGMSWRVGIRNGDTDINERQRQKRLMPEVLLITPESLHLLLAQKGYADVFKSLRIIAVDEWHELIGSKRGVQVELAVSRIVHVQQQLFGTYCNVWGISATIWQYAGSAGCAALAGSGVEWQTGCSGEGIFKKEVRIESILPDEIEKFPWAGHLGLKLVDKVLPILDQSKTTLIFINTRGMAERWYQTLLTASPELAGAIALHHGSIEQELRIWVEEALHTARLKAVVCTASLDLGVDFRPVETVIQVGSPKGVARFLQRAGEAVTVRVKSVQFIFYPRIRWNWLKWRRSNPPLQRIISRTGIPCCSVTMC